MYAIPHKQYQDEAYLFVAQLTDIQDGFEVFSESDSAITALHELVDDVRAEYNSIHRDRYGSFPLL
jgi:hypothetical protein